MELLTAINICAQWGSGSRPFDDPDNAPQAILDAIDLGKREVLGGALKVNTDQFDLTRNAANQIKIPIEFIGVALPEPFTIRDRFIYDRKNRTNVLDQDFTDLFVALDIPFNELPHVAANYIAWSACRDYAAQSRSAANPRFAFAEDKWANAEVAYFSEYPAAFSTESPFATWSSRPIPIGFSWCWCSSSFCCR